jgi:ADP-heptose:LPS heptosyltransferase
VHALPEPVATAVRLEGRDLIVLVVRLGALGDVLRTLPAVRLLRRGLPAARILWLVDDRWRIAIEGDRDLDGTIVLPRREWRRLVRSPLGWPALLRSFARFRRLLRSERPSLVLDFHGNLRSAVAGWLSGAPVRVGYGGAHQREGNARLNTHHAPGLARRVSRIERSLSLLRWLGLPDGPLPPAAPPLVEAGGRSADEIERWIGPGRAWAILAPSASASQAYKKPPAHLLAAACRRLDGHGIVPLVVWGPGEESDAARVVDAAGGGTRLAPPTDLPALAALLARARLFVGGDSGPLHLACATGCPAIALYGPTDPVVNAPWGVPHRSVAPEGRTYTGIKRIDRQGGFAGVRAAQVEAAVDGLLADTAAWLPAAGRLLPRTAPAEPV